MSKPESPLLTIPEVARRLKVGRSSVYTCLRSGLKSIRIGKCVRVASDDLDAFIAARRTSRLSEQEPGNPWPKNKRPPPGERGRRMLVPGPRRRANSLYTL